MDQFSTRIKEISGDIKSYLETRIELIVINVSEKVTLWIGYSIQKMTGYIILASGLLFAIFALALYLGDLLGHASFGFLIVSVPLIILGCIYALSRPKGMARNIQSQFMSEVLKALEETEKEELPKLPLPEQEQEEKTDG